MFLYFICCIYFELFIYCFCYFLFLFLFFFLFFLLYFYIFFFFFFSSRRRHTRSLCDWSSDVCSSDLPGSHRLEEVPEECARDVTVGTARPHTLHRIIPGTGPIGKRDVPLQQMVDVRAEAELAEEERGEGHGEEPLEDVGRRPPSLEQGQPRGQHEHRRHALGESPGPRRRRERRSPAPSRDKAVVNILERVGRRHEHVEPQEGRNEQKDRRRLGEDRHQHQRSHDRGLELQALEPQGRAIGRLLREPLLLHEVHHG